MMKLYFAGPLFNIAERTFNSTLAKQIEELGYNVFLPQRDGIENFSEKQKTTVEEKRRLMFCLDRDKILETDVFLFILDGRVPDEGACLELGISYTNKYINNKNTRIIGLHTDSRAAFIQGKLNPMILMAFDVIFKNVEELLMYLRDNSE